MTPFGFIWFLKDYIAKSDSERKLVSKKHSADDVIAYLAQYFNVEVDEIIAVKKGQKRKIYHAGLLLNYAKI